MRNVELRLGAFVAVAGWATFLPVGAVVAGDAPARGPSGQTLVAPDAQLDLGEVFHIIPGEDAQLVCTSDAPLQRISAVCRRVVGYVIRPFDAEEGDAPIVAGACRIPVASLTTGNAGQDGVLRSAAMLDIANHPEMTFVITEVRDAKKVGGGADEHAATEYELTVAGELMVKGEPHRIEAAARVAVIPFTWQTMQRYPGDFISVRSEFDVALADVGLSKPGRGWEQRCADSLHVDVFFLCNSVSPAKSLDPSVPQVNADRFQQFFTLLRDLARTDEAYAFGREALDAAWDDARELNRYADALLTDADIVRPDFAFVRRAIERAVELTKGEDGALLDTRAALAYRMGDAAAAVEWQRKAVEHLEGLPPPVATQVRARLTEYERAAGAASE